MEKEKRNRKIAIFFVVSLGIALAHGLYAYFNQHATESAFLADFNAQRDILEHALQAQVENATKNLLFIANIFASDEEVQRLFLAGKQAVEAEGGGAGKAAAARARKALNDAVAPKWNRALEGFQTRQLHFHLAPGSLSFLRVHQPEQYGDRLDDLRFIVVDSNADRQPRTGFESGRLFSGLRGVMPVWARDPATGQPVHVGAVEAGTSFSNALQAIDRNFGVGAAILLRADHVTSVAWPATLKHKQGDKLDPCGCYLDSASRDDASELIRRAIVQTGPFGSAEAVHFVDLGSTKIALFLAPIRDYLGNRDSRRPNVGLAVFWRDVSQQYATYQR